MAPRKPTAAADKAKKNPVNKTDKVVNRPARGYSKYKNGFLNVTPTDKEMEMVKSNQESPLLRLPPEIRNKIWEYTLGHSILKPIRVRLGKRNYKHRWISRRDEPQISLSLLATCRQIYSEAALMPFRLNAFATDTWYQDRKNLARSFTVFKVHQRMQITSIGLEYFTFSTLEWNDWNDCYETHLRKCGSQLERWLPNLNTIEFAVVGASQAHSLRSTATIAHIKAALHRGISTHTRIDVRVNSQNSADT